MYIRVESRCFTRNFVKAIKVLLNDQAELVASDGSRGVLSKSLLEYFTVGSSAGEMYGIVVGRGTTSPTPDDTWLENPVEHGDQANQLFYWDTMVGNVELGTNRVRFLVTRIVENKTGSDQQITELGLAAKCKLNVQGSIEDKIVLLARDVLQNPVTIPAGGALRIDYVIYVPV